MCVYENTIVHVALAGSTNLGVSRGADKAVSPPTEIIPELRKTLTLNKLHAAPLSGGAGAGVVAGLYTGGRVFISDTALLDKFIKEEELVGDDHSRMKWGEVDVGGSLIKLPDGPFEHRESGVDDDKKVVGT